MLATKKYPNKKPWKPLVVFAFKQVSLFNYVSPVSLEADLHRIVAESIIEFTSKDPADFKPLFSTISSSGPFGFEYFSGELGITKICHIDNNRDIFEHFIPVSSRDLVQINKALTEVHANKLSCLNC